VRPAEARSLTVRTAQESKGEQDEGSREAAMARWERWERWEMGDGREREMGETERS
jgi:hypothetical protein